MNHEYRFMLSTALRVKLSQAIYLILWILSDSGNAGTGITILTGIDGSMEPVFAVTLRFMN
jgi:hypothetical protein